MDVLVMGGTRFMGPAVVRELLQRGHLVTVFNRGSRTILWDGPVREVVGDRDRVEHLAQLRDAAFDAVIDLSAYQPEQTMNLLAILDRTPRLVHCSTGAVYAPQAVLPWPESTPYGPWSVWGAYARSKLECENVLLEHRAPEQSTLLLRLPYVLGPYNYVAREEFVFNRLLDHAEILVPEDGKAVQQFVSTLQVGDAFVKAIESGIAGVTAFNIAPRENLASLDGFVRLCAELAGVEPRVEYLGRPAETGESVFDPADCVFPFPNENYILDGAASEAAGIAPRADSLRAMLERGLQALLGDSGRRRWSRTEAEKRQLGS